MYIELNLEDIKRLTYKYAHKFDVNMPPKWTETGSEGKYWLGYFLLCYPELTLRSPKATSFNHHNMIFFLNLNMCT